jgi:phosphotransacetylase
MEQVRLRGETEGLVVTASVIQDATRVTATLAVTGLEDKVAQMADWFVTLEDELEELAEEAAEAADTAADEAAEEARAASESGSN